MLLLLFLLDRAQPKKFSFTTQRVCYLANNSNRQFQLFGYFVNLQMLGDIFSTGGVCDSVRIVQRTETPHIISNLVGPYVIQHRFTN